MSLVELLAHPVSRQLTLALAHFVWQGLAVAMILILAVELLGVRRPAARYTCSLTALLLMVLCPVATFLWIGAEDHSLRASGFIPEAYRSPLPNLDLTADAASPTTAGPASAAWSLNRWTQAAQPYALAAWLIGVSILAGRLAAGAIGILRLRQKLIPLPLDLASSVERLGRRLGVEALPLVFLSRRVTEAMAVGVVRPLVLIPAAWATEMPLEMLEAVIAHELAHLRRRDLWVNLLQRVVETVLFYHPAVWWLSHRLRQERELCADELAVAATGSRLEYAQTLEQVARRRQADVGPALAAFIRGGKNMRLLERVQNVLGLAAGTDRARLWPVGLLILALPLVLWMVSLGLSAAVADDDREDGDRPRAAREAEDDEDGDRRNGRREDDEDDDEGDDDEDEGDDDDDDEGDDDDDDEGDDDEDEGDDDDDDEGDDDDEDEGDDDEKEGKGNDDKDERDGKGDADKEEKDDDGDGDKEDKKFFGKEEREEKETRKDGDVKKEGPRDGDAPKKEGARDGDVKKDGARDGDAPKKEGARDGDAPKKVGARDGDAPKKEVRKDEPRKEGDKPGKEGAREGDKKVIKKDGAEGEGAIGELKALVSKLMAENKELRAELAAARGGKDYGVKKEGGDKEVIIRKERAFEERKKPEGREGDEKALIEKKRAAAEKDREAEAGERKEGVRKEVEKKEVERNEGEKKEGDRKEDDQPKK